MKKTIKIAVIAVCAMSLVAPRLSAQTELNLQEMIAIALEQNYQIQIFRNTASAAELNNTAGNAGMLPEVFAEAEARRQLNNTRQVFFSGDSQVANNALNEGISANLGARWIVFDGFAMFGRRDRLDQLERLSKADQRFYMEQTVADIANAYYQLKQETQLLAAYQKSLDVSQTRFNYEKRAVEVGASNQLDLQLARVDRNTDSSLVISQEARLQEITIALNRLMNRDVAANITALDSIVLRLDFALVDLLAEAQAANSQLDAQQLNELIALSEAKIFRGAMWPEIEVFGNYSYNRQTNEAGFLQQSRTFGPDFGLRLRFNLFTGSQARIASQTATINAENERLRYDDVSAEIDATMRTAYLQWSAAVRQVGVEKEGVSAARKAMTIATEQYRVGVITNIDFRIIQLNAINAESRFLLAQFNAKSREIEMLRISGKLLESVF